MGGEGKEGGRGRVGGGGRLLVLVSTVVTQR